MHRRGHLIVPAIFRVRHQRNDSWLEPEDNSAFAIEPRFGQYATIGQDKRQSSNCARDRKRAAVSLHVWRTNGDAR